LKGPAGHEPARLATCIKPRKKPHNLFSRSCGVSSELSGLYTGLPIFNQGTRVFEGKQLLFSMLLVGRVLPGKGLPFDLVAHGGYDNKHCVSVVFVASPASVKGFWVFFRGLAVCDE
jgi:hypothetical protein